LAFLAFALICCGRPAAGQEAIGMHLENAGFIMRPAITPEQQARMRKLPARKFIARAKAGVRYFIYADPDYCKCVFLGNQEAMRNFRDIQSTTLPQLDDVPAAGVSPTNEIIQDMDEDLPDGDLFDFPF